MPDDAYLSPAGVGLHGAVECFTYGVKLVGLGQNLGMGLVVVGAGTHEEGEASHHIEQDVGGSEGLYDAAELGAEAAVFVVVSAIGGLCTLGVVVPLCGV